MSNLICQQEISEFGFLVNGARVTLCQQSDDDSSAPPTSPSLSPSFVIARPERSLVPSLEVALARNLNRTNKSFDPAILESHTTRLYPCLSTAAVPRMVVLLSIPQTAIRIATLPALLGPDSPLGPIWQVAGREGLQRLIPDDLREPTADRRATDAATG